MKSQNETVSVIIPVYNVFAYLQESISSVIHQTYDHLEIIIVDDGSTDGSGEVCDKFAETDKRIKVLHTENRGLSAARNKGLQVMTGEIVAFLDSDDAFVPDAIEKAVYAMKEQNADISLFGFASIKTEEGHLSKDHFEDQHGLSFIPPGGLYNSNTILRLLLQGKKIVTAAWCMMYRVSLWKGLFFPEGYVYEDNHITPVIIQRASRIVVLSEILVLNRRREGSITRTHTEKNMRDQQKAMRFLSEFVKNNTPEIFDDPLPLRMQEDEIALMVKQYSISRGTQFKKEIRNRIVQKARMLKNKELKLVTRIRIVGMQYMPGLFSRVLYYCLYCRKIEY